jgi:hypothetical protein
MNDNRNLSNRIHNVQNQNHNFDTLTSIERLQMQLLNCLAHRRTMANVDIMYTCKHGYSLGVDIVCQQIILIAF